NELPQQDQPPLANRGVRRHDEHFVEKRIDNRLESRRLCKGLTEARPLFDRLFNDWPSRVDLCEKRAFGRLRQRLEVRVGDVRVTKRRVHAARDVLGPIERDRKSLKIRSRREFGKAAQLLSLVGRTNFVETSAPRHRPDVTNVMAATFENESKPLDQKIEKVQ